MANAAERVKNTTTAVESRAIARREGIQSIVSYIEGRKQHLAAALPRQIGIERAFRLYLTAFRKQPELGECDPRSVYGALLTAAQLGLEIGVFNSAFLIPRYAKGQRDKECGLMIGYEGLRDLAMRDGRIVRMWADLVYEGDEFNVERGSHPRLSHTPAKVSADTKDRKDQIVAAYAVAEFRDGGRMFEILWRYEIEKRRARSQASNSGPWVTDWEAMAKKSAVRALCTLLPKTPELARAVELDQALEIGQPQYLTEAIEENGNDADYKIVEPEDESQEETIEEKTLAELQDEMQPESPPEEHKVTALKDKDGNVARYTCGCGFITEDPEVAARHVDGEPPENNSGQ